jgi:hypothetical protein
MMESQHVKQVYGSDNKIDNKAGLVHGSAPLAGLLLSVSLPVSDTGEKSPCLVEHLVLRS